VPHDPCGRWRSWDSSTNTFRSIPRATRANPEYVKVNPNGHVPALEDDGQVFWESMAVNLYLAGKYGKAPLWPSSVADHGHAYQWSLWAMTEERLRVTLQTQTPHHQAREAFIRIR
jgi:glutathione S-transferase